MKTISSLTGLITLFLFLFMNTLPGLALAIPKAPDSAGKAHIVKNYGKLPLSFEKNQGQTDEKVRFLSRGGRYTLFLAPDEAVLALRSPLKDEDLGDKQKAASRVSRPEKQKMAEGAVIRMKFSGANTAPVISGQERLQETSNYFIGNDPSMWRTRIPKYAKVRYREVYPGIDLVFYGNQRRLEYDFVVSPGSDPSKIKLEFQGAEKISLDEKGNLVLRLKDGEVIQQAPVIYQEVDGKRVDVPGGYLIDHKGRVGCRVASWDRQRPLVIDPVLVYSTYLGGSSGYSIAVDSFGNAYVTGNAGPDFPTVNALYPDLWGNIDAFIFKLSADGSQAVYSTYLGGSSNDGGYSIAVDNSGNAYVTGWTYSSDFPTVTALYPDYSGNGDAFIFKLSADGSQAVYSTYLGGSSDDWGLGIAVDGSGNAYVSGATGSSDFPTVTALYPNLHSTSDAFIFKLSADGSQAVYSTYLGGYDWDWGEGIAVDGSGNAYVTGITYSSDFPTVNALYPDFQGGGRDAFIFKLSADGSQAVYSTYLGGSSNDDGEGIAVDGSGNAYVSGETFSSDFPTVNALYPHNSGGLDTFIFKLSADGSQAIYSTYLGGSDWDWGLGIAVDGLGNAYVTGKTRSSDFPTVNALYPDFQGGEYDAFIFKLSADGSQAVYSTYLGGNSSDYGRGIAIDGSGNAYVTGTTYSPDFPTVNALYPTHGGGNVDAFIAKISSDLHPVLTTGDVDPDIGDDTTIFTYTVHYYDQDGDSPSDRYVYIDGSSHIMTLYSGSASDGTYQYQTTLSCTPDPHNYYFEFTDGQGGSDRLPDSGTYSGPDMICNGLYQIVRPANTPINCAAEREFILPVEYDTSDGNNQLMGIGIRVHFDSSKLNWMDYDAVFTTGLAGKDLVPVPDTGDYDGDPVTDYYLGLAWFDISSQWPNTALPLRLADMRFRTENLPEGDTTQINFSCSSTDSDYECQLSPATVVIIPPCTLDIDGNGQYDALTDGILILRYLFGFRGATLIDGAVAPDCTRCTAPEIEAWLADCESCCLDIDGNGAADALTDGILILRYLFGFRGITLIDGAVAPDCTRCTAPEIEAYIQGLMP